MFVWLAYALGQGLHVLAQVSGRAKDRKVAFKRVLLENWIILAIRVSVCSFGLALFNAHPDALYRLLSWVGWANVTDTTLRISAPIAFFYGLGSDVLLSEILRRIPKLQRIVPADPIPEPEAPSAP